MTMESSKTLYHNHNFLSFTRAQKIDFKVYNPSMCGTNPTTKTEANKSAPFITKKRSNLAYFRTSGKIWKWASRISIRFSPYVIVLNFCTRTNIKKYAYTRFEFQFLHFRSDSTLTLNTYICLNDNHASEVLSNKQ